MVIIKEKKQTKQKTHFAYQAKNFKDTALVRSVGIQSFLLLNGVVNWCNLFDGISQKCQMCIPWSNKYTSSYLYYRNTHTGNKIYVQDVNYTCYL